MFDDSFFSIKKMRSIEQVESAQLQKLIQFLLESTARRKLFELKFEEIDQDLYFSNEITFEHIGVAPYHHQDKERKYP